MVTSKPTTSTTTVSPTPQQIAEGKARAGGQTATSEQLVDKVSPQAKQAGDGVEKTKKTANKKIGLIGVPIDTEIVVGQGADQPPQFAGGKPVPGAPITKKVKYAKGDGQTYFLTLSNKDKAALLYKLSQIPGVYGKGQAPTTDYISNLLAQGNVAIRPVDAEALENVMKYADTVGESVTVSVDKLYQQPKFAQQFFAIKTTAPKKVKVTPELALNAEITAAFQDYLDLPIDAKIAKKYSSAVNAAEKQRGGALTSLERNNILLGPVQQKAADVFKDSVAAGDSTLLEKGALGGAFRKLRAAYTEFGVPVTDKKLYTEAIDSVRSTQAMNNIMNRIQTQAEIAFPAIKDYIKGGMSVRDALASHISMYSTILGIPENQVKISDVASVAAGDKLIGLPDWKKTLFADPRFKQSDTYQQLKISDARSLFRNFIGQVGNGYTRRCCRTTQNC